MATSEHSKSNYIAYLRCSHRFLDYGYQQSSTPFTSLGDLVGERARSDNFQDFISQCEDADIQEIKNAAQKKFPGGVRVTTYGPDFDWTTAILKTKDLLRDPKKRILYEAAFARDGFVCLVDILVRRSDGSWSALEVKSILDKNACGKLRQSLGRIADDGTWLDDIAFQQWIVSSSIDVEFKMLCVSNQHQIDNGVNYFTTKITKHQSWLDRYFVNGVFDFAKAIADKLETLPNNLAGMKAGKQLAKPRRVSVCKACDFVTDCRGQDWGGLFYQGKALQDKKLSELTDEDFKNADGTHSTIGRIQCRILKSIRLNEEIIDHNTLAQFGNHPINSYDRIIDFECFIHPFVFWPRQTPWQQVAFMFSWDKPTETDKPLIIRAPNTDDPRPFIILKLIDLLNDCPGRLFHHSPFDCTAMDSLIEYETDQGRKEKLGRLRRKMVDSCEMVKNTTYHPDFQQSFSIKNVGPHFSGIKYSGTSNAIQVGLDWWQGKNLEAADEYCALDATQVKFALRAILGTGPAKYWIGDIDPDIGQICSTPKLGNSVSFDPAEVDVLTNTGFVNDPSKSRAFVFGQYRIRKRLDQDGVPYYYVTCASRKGGQEKICTTPVLIDAIKATSVGPASKTLSDPLPDVSYETVVQSYYVKSGHTCYNMPHREIMVKKLFFALRGHEWDDVSREGGGKQFDAVNRKTGGTAEFKSAKLDKKCQFTYDKQNDPKRREETLAYDLHCFTPISDELPQAFIIIKKSEHLIEVLQSKQQQWLDKHNDRNSDDRISNHDGIVITLKEILGHFGDTELEIYIPADQSKPFNEMNFLRTTKANFLELFRTRIR